MPSAQRKILILFALFATPLLDCPALADNSASVTSVLSSPVNGLSLQIEGPVSEGGATDRFRLILRGGTGDNFVCFGRKFSSLEILDASGRELSTDLPHASISNFDWAPQGTAKISKVIPSGGLQARPVSISQYYRHLAPGNYFAVGKLLTEQGLANGDCANPVKIRSKPLPFTIR